MRDRKKPKPHKPDPTAGYVEDIVAGGIRLKWHRTKEGRRFISATHIRNGAIVGPEDIIGVPTKEAVLSALIRKIAAAKS